MNNKNYEVVKGLKPEKLWRIFSEIASVPRPSKKEEKIRKYLVEFAKNLNLECKTDKIGNVIIYKEAQKSTSNKTIILQAHMDMVCEKDPDVNIDFENDPITLMKEGDNLTAKGTTLGADDGIGVATALAILEDKEMIHPNLQVLITVDEETGMTGAFELDASLLKAEYLINLDTEVEGEVYVGCAGGEQTEVEYNIKKEQINKEAHTINLKVDRLHGGHSGVDIKENFGNAIKLGTYLITQIIKQNISFNLIEIDGGSAHNAIPRSADFIFSIDAKDKDNVISIINKEKEKIEEEYRKGTEPNIKITITESDKEQKEGITKEISKNIIMGLNNVHSGIYRMSKVIDGLVETSNNLSTVKQTEKNIQITAATRSSNMTELDIATNMIQTQFLSSGADKVESLGRYPGWDPVPIEKNPLLQKYIDVHEKVRGKKPAIMAIHAGLECGLLGEKLPSTLMISVGPDIHNPHSPSEYVGIESVNKYWEVVVELLKSI